MQRLNEINLSVPFQNGEVVTIWIASRFEEDIICVISEEEAWENGEACIQLQEGKSYEYKITSGYQLNGNKQVIQHSKLLPSTGVLQTRNYVGTLQLFISKINDPELQGSFSLEVQSSKIDYRADYRLMLHEIATRCTELVMQHGSPISQKFSPDHTRKSQTAYQKFVFIKALISTEEFEQAIHKILVSPVVCWRSEESEIGVDRIRRLSSRLLRQLSNVSSGSRTKLSTIENKPTVDAPENKFVKYVLNQFLDVCTDILSSLKKDSKFFEEVIQLQEKLQQYLNHDLFKEIGPLLSVPLNSPILQRKEGYREVLRAWIMLEFAAQLEWTGGLDVYDAGKKDVALLYEYWLFFKLHDIIVKVFNLPATESSAFIEPTNDGLGLKLKKGKLLIINGVCETPTRKLNVQFSYNRTFSKQKPYPDPGSWTSTLRPDYTLSIWPFGLSSEEAEEEELIAHLHFDAKYRVEASKKPLADILSEDSPDYEPKSNFLKENLLKMHTYRDAIRRTEGAYVLYPGNQSANFRGFHEILPGLGAFAVNPSNSNGSLFQLEKFFQEVLDLFVNRASQREKLSLKKFEIHKTPPTQYLNIQLPEPIKNNRHLLPEETTVLVGYYKGKTHLDWIKSRRLYNTRIKQKQGSLHLDQALMGAKYLLLHNKAEKKEAIHLFKLIPGGGRIFTKEELKRNGYPTKPSQSYYLIFELETVLEKEFDGRKWDVAKLKKYNYTKGYAFPFAVELAELMRCLIP